METEYTIIYDDQSTSVFHSEGADILSIILEAMDNGLIAYIPRVLVVEGGNFTGDNAQAVTGSYVVRALIKNHVDDSGEWLTPKNKIACIKTIKRYSGHTPLSTVIKAVEQIQADLKRERDDAFTLALLEIESATVH